MIESPEKSAREQTTFRVATTNDITAIVRLVTSAYRGDESRAGWTTEADLLNGERITPQVLLADMQRDHSNVLLAERDTKLIGCVHVELIEPGTGYLGMFAVSPTEQGRGTGKQIMEVAESFVKREWGATSMKMTVIDVRAELIAFYERRGYARTGILTPFPSDNPDFGAPTQALQFETLVKSLA
ncbi:GNAT family N-acetyltransferase [Lysinibacter cavernae]|uniref:N-acetylglutamate synthase-like GNAT family acetyltransferase n=1 Tax=Lysinibacter cavernae TaxID=1640652 RepID=A0A7X5R2L5_9MICO|nr:N-acetylglutamate synthase-like GNAT family acetyltransferase [Lysinibacter cavernae]